MEDYHLTRMGLVSILSTFPQLKFVGEAESAEDGLAQLETVPVDVLILDLGLPGMNGIEMAQEVRLRWPDTKIVILTSHNQQEEVIAALSAGANAYALKTIDPNRLVQVIETVYEGAAWIDPALASIVMSTLVEPLGPDGKSSRAIDAVKSEPPVDLTEREREVLQLLVQGKNNKDIAEELCITIHTAKAHVGNILMKLSVSDRVQAVIKAIKENLV